jgi:Holliday junction resolvase-like predicted endonuclease
MCRGWSNAPMARCQDQGRPTRRMRAGSVGERLVAEYLGGLGWTVLARNVRVGRSELDLVAIDPGPPAMLVVVEVRANRQSSFGSPEERIDQRKLGAVYRGALALRAAGQLPVTDARSGTAWLPRLPLRVDVVSVEIAPGLGRGIDGTALRHLRSVIR